MSQKVGSARKRTGSFTNDLLEVSCVKKVHGVQVHVTMEVRAHMDVGDDHSFLLLLDSVRTVYPFFVDVRNKSEIHLPGLAYRDLYLGISLPGIARRRSPGNATRRAQNTLP